VQSNLSEVPFDEVVQRIFTSKRITRSDQSRVMAALLSKASLSATERGYVDRVFEYLQRGLIHVVD
jgi:hypothetical protein